MKKKASARRTRRTHNPAFKTKVALSETIRLMAEIDRVIDAHGGWPGAFQTAAKA